MKLFDDSHTTEEWGEILSLIVWLIGKFHIGGHQKSCSARFSFNYTIGAGRMSGELVETIWVEFNFYKHQTREMTEGGRRDLLNDAFNHWNWMKCIGMGEFCLFVGTGIHSVSLY